MVYGTGKKIKLISLTLLDDIMKYETSSRLQDVYMLPCET